MTSLGHYFRNLNKIHGVLSYTEHKQNFVCWGKPSARGGIQKFVQFLQGCLVCLGNSSYLTGILAYNKFSFYLWVGGIFFLPLCSKSDNFGNHSVSHMISVMYGRDIALL